MRVRLDYGVDGLEVDLPHDARHDHRAGVQACGGGSAWPRWRRRFARRWAGRRFESWSGGGRPIAISVCDITRAQPRQEMLEALFAEMPDIPAEDITILIATGTHRTNTPAELENMLGADIARRYRVINHDSRDRASLDVHRHDDHRRAGAT